MPAARPAAQLLTGFGSCADLLSGLRAHTAANVTAYGLPGALYYGDNLAVRGSALAPSAGPAYSATAGVPVQRSADAGGTTTTNDQVAGVDEPDVMKTDGDRVVTVTDGTLRVVDTATRKVTGSLDLTVYAGWQNAQLLVAGDHALALLSAGGYSVPYAGMATPFVPSAATGTGTTALFVDLSGPAPSVTGTLRADGGYLAARLVGDTVRMVTVSAPTINFPRGGTHTKARNRKIVREAPLSAWLPSYTFDNGGPATTRHSVPCTAISHPADYTGTSLITVYALTLGQPDANPQPISVVADGDTVYATATSLYVASNPDWWTPGRAARHHTEIHRFDISGTAPPRYLGSGSVPGRLLSQYSLDDYDGYLRVATTDIGAGRTNGVYELAADTLTVVGHVRGLGRGEQIDAVRFLGPLAYVVTFRQVDPLYVVDLSDPRAPKLAGTLRVSGYSTYLHDAGNGRLLGVGASVGKHNEPDGVQVSLYDVSDPSAPKRTGNVVSHAPGGGSRPLDPHAFLYWAPTGLVVVPQQACQPDKSGAAIVLKVHGRQLSLLGTVRNPVGTAIPDDGRGIQRSMLVDGQLWALSGSGVQVLDPATLDRADWIAFS
jgi:hypothetical protein